MMKKIILLTAASSLSSFGGVQGFSVDSSSSITTSSVLYAAKKKGIMPEVEDFDATGGRPGAIIESEAELARKQEIFRELRDGTRVMPEWASEYEADEYSEDLDLESKPGEWNILDLKSKFDYELDPEKGDADPNLLDPNERYIADIPRDEEGVELGWDPMRGSSNPIDERTIIGTVDSYMVDPETRDNSKLTPVFEEGDVEEGYNEEIGLFRKSLDIIETYTDPFLGPDVEVPRNVAKWHGKPIRLSYPKKDYMNNRFTKEEDVTPFDDFAPYKARKTAVFYARSKNTEWMKTEVAQEYHDGQRAPYIKYKTLMGTMREGEKDPATVEAIQPALKILGSIVRLLSIEGEDNTIFRFKYNGLIKNRFGMECWTQTLIRDCDVECDNVVFETGFRKRDPWYDGGDPYYMIW